MQDVNYITLVNADTGAASWAPNHSGLSIGDLTDNAKVIYAGTKETAAAGADGINAALAQDGRSPAERRQALIEAAVAEVKDSLRWNAFNGCSLQDLDLRVNVSSVPRGYVDFGKVVFQTSWGINEMFDTVDDFLAKYGR